MKLWNCGIDKIAIENPIGIMSSRLRKPDQVLQPWMFGHGETKATCLWLKGLPMLRPTNIVNGREQRPSNIKKTKNSIDEGLNYSGIDRVDSLKDYTVENTVPCCRICNTAKSNLTLIEFKEWAIQLGKQAMATQWTEYLMSRR